MRNLPSVVYLIHSFVDKPNGWNEPHVADYDECPPHSNCLTIDVETLCAKTSSDFNYYAVCKGLLSEESQDEGWFYNLIQAHSPTASAQRHF